MTTKRRVKLTPGQPFAVSHWPPHAGNGGASDLGQRNLRDVTVNPSRLANCCVLLMGVGAVNGILFRTLAQVGVGTMIVCDMDDYDLKSHWTQPVEPGHEGESKVLVQAAAARRINPGLRIVAFHGFAQDLPLGLARAADVFVVAGDNLELVVHASQLAMGLGKPLLEAAVMGESATAHLRRYDLSNPSSVCPACGLNEREWSSLKSRVGCSSVETVVPGSQPTRTSPALCGVAAHMAACEVLKEIAGDGPRLDGADVTYCLANHQVYRTKLPQSDRCRLSHRAWQIIDVSEPPAQLTLRTLVDRFAPEGRVQCKAELPWIHEARCSSPRCGNVVRVQRFARWGTDLGPCRCEGRFEAWPVGQRSVLPAADLHDCLDRPLDELGLDIGDTVALSTDDVWTYCFLGGATLSDLLNKWEQRDD